MGSTSEEDSEISDSEIPTEKEKIYEELVRGKYRVLLSKDIYRCPFCLGKKKQQHDYKSLMQHASGVGKGSANRRAKQKANHLALAKYIETHLTIAPPLLLTYPTEQDSGVEPEADKDSEEDIDQYVWPWTGILVNLPKPRDDDARYIKREFSRFNPIEVQTLWNRKDQVGYAILSFSNDWKGFKNAMEFEKEYEAKQHGKTYWNKRKDDPGSRRYGWCARADDYHSEGKIGEHLRQNGEVKTIKDIVEEAKKEKQEKLDILTNEIDAKNEDLDKLHCKYNETTMSLDRLMEEKDRRQQAHNEEIRKLQRAARERTQKILYESEHLKRDLDAKKKDMEHWSNQLNKREYFNERERRKLEEEKNKSTMKNNSLAMATMEQKKADEKVLRLIEDQKREKEVALNKILELERKLDAKQKLELEIQELQGNLQVMKHMGGEDDQKLQEKIKKIDDELKDKMEEMDDLEEMNKTLLVKERKSNDELQEARKELIMGLRDMLTARTLIIVKRMGDLDEKPFQKACKERFPGSEAMVKSAELVSLWQEHLKNPDWHPFRIVEDKGSHKEIINEEDEKLIGVRKELGDEVCEAIITAMKELNEVNPSGRYIIPELWNLKENRKASMKEVIAYILRSLKSNKRKR